MVSKLNSQKKRPKKEPRRPFSIPSSGYEKQERWWNKWHTNPQKIWEKAATNPETARRLLKELSERRLSSDKDLVDNKFKSQAAFIRDPAKFKAALCTRRAGKSYGAGLYLCNEALKNPGVSNLYIALTRDSAKRIMFKDVLQIINTKHELNAKFNHVDLTMTFPNGAVIYLMGLDNSDQEAEKILGQKFKLVIIDEAASFRRDLESIIYGTIKPALVDLDGTLAMIGTPGKHKKSYYYQVTDKQEPGWSVHKWTGNDNPYIEKLWAAEIASMIAANPRIVETPMFQQNYLGRWVIDESNLCYAFNKERNLCKIYPTNDMLHVFGIDLGYKDATAISVLGYSHTYPKVIVKKVFKESGLILSEVAAVIKKLQAIYNPVRMRVDNASKQAVEELKQRYELPLMPADKTGKADFIELMNSEFINGRIELLEEETRQLIDEYENLIWDDKADRLQEHPACENHAADATLYAWRDCREHLLYKEQKPKTQLDILDAWEADEANRIEQEKNKPWWENF